MTNKERVFENMVQEFELAAQAIKHEFDHDHSSPEWQLGEAMDVVNKFYRARKGREVKNGQ